VKVKELIAKLKEMPQEMEVWHVWDGEARTQLKHVWISRNGKVITADDGESVYSTESRPEGEGIDGDYHGWKTPGNGGW